MLWTERDIMYLSALYTDESFESAKHLIDPTKYRKLTELTANRVVITFAYSEIGSQLVHASEYPLILLDVRYVETIVKLDDLIQIHQLMLLCGNQPDVFQTMASEYLNQQGYKPNES